MPEDIQLEPINFSKDDQSKNTRKRQREKSSTNGLVTNPDQTLNKLNSRQKVQHREINKLASDLTKTLTPTSLCMVLVITMNQVLNEDILSLLQMKIQELFHGKPRPIFQLHKYSESDVGNQMDSKLLLALLTTAIPVYSVLLVLSKKFKVCQLIFKCVIFLAMVILLFVFSLLFLARLINIHHLTLDYFSLAIIMWNFAIIGFISILEKGPQVIQHLYQIFMICLMALLFANSLQDNIIWMLLVIMIIWDLFAVLCPNGPLKILNEEPQEVNDQTFAPLVYSFSTRNDEISSTPEVQNVQELRKFIVAKRYVQFDIILSILN